MNGQWSKSKVKIQSQNQQSDDQSLTINDRQIVNDFPTGRNAGSRTSHCQKGKVTYFHSLVPIMSELSGELFFFCDSHAEGSQQVIANYGRLVKSHGQWLC